MWESECGCRGGGLFCTSQLQYEYPNNTLAKKAKNVHINDDNLANIDSTTQLAFLSK